MSDQIRDGWEPGSSLDFIKERVFVRHGEYYAGSPPEIYITELLELNGLVQTIITYLPNETRLLEKCLERLRISLPRRLYTAGEKQRPFPNNIHEKYIQSVSPRMDKIESYFERVTIDSLKRGVEFYDD